MEKNRKTIFKKRKVHLKFLWLIFLILVDKIKVFIKIVNDITKIINSNDFINGKAVKLFEKKFAKFCSTKNCISVANGTDALFIALKALNLNKGDEVIVPAMTWKSSVLASFNLDFKTILVDIEKNGSDFDLIKLKKKITKKTKAIIVVHLYGNPANIKGIKRLIKNKNISIIEDAAKHMALLIWV